MHFWPREPTEELAPVAPRIDPVLQCRWGRCTLVFVNAKVATVTVVLRVS